MINVAIYLLFTVHDQIIGIAYYEGATLFSVKLQWMTSFEYKGQQGRASGNWHD